MTAIQLYEWLTPLVDNGYGDSEVVFENTLSDITTAKFEMTSDGRRTVWLARLTLNTYSRSKRE